MYAGREATRSVRLGVTKSLLRSYCNFDYSRITRLVLWFNQARIVQCLLYKLNKHIAYTNQIKKKIKKCKKHRHVYNYRGKKFARSKPHSFKRIIIIKTIVAVIFHVLITRVFSWIFFRNFNLESFSGHAHERRQKSKNRNNRENSRYLRTVFFVNIISYPTWCDGQNRLAILYTLNTFLKRAGVLRLGYFYDEKRKQKKNNPIPFCTDHVRYWFFFCRLERNNFFYFVENKLNVNICSKKDVEKNLSPEAKVDVHVCI